MQTVQILKRCRTRAEIIQTDLKPVILQDFDEVVDHVQILNRRRFSDLEHQPFGQFFIQGQLGVKRFEKLLVLDRLPRQVDGEFRLAAL